ncbi:MAG: 30S ribosomal protein S4e [Gammaproteobacteria bacterium]
MARKGVRTRLKRHAAPAFWTIPRKRFRFAVRAAAGPHAAPASYPLAVIVRDLLGLARNYREARATITEGRITVDGVVRRDPHFPVGVMDVVEIAGIGKVYRFLPRDGAPLVPVEIPETEKGLKLCQIRSKTTVRGGKLQYGLHDGRTILPAGEVEFNVGDTCLVDVPSQRIQRALKLEKNAQVIVVRGQNAGTVGQVDQLLPGSFSRRAMARLKVRGRAVEVPTRLLLVVGKDQPAITLGRE